MIEDKVSKKELERIRKDIASEGEEIDYKEVFKFTNRKDKLELIKDIVAIANTRGGYIVYGVKEEHNGKFEFIGLDSRSDIIKHENILDFMKNYVNFRVNIAVGVHEIKDETFYLIYVAKHVEDDLISFTKDGTYERENFKGNKQNKTVFKKYEMYGRKGCENTIINHDTQFKKIRNSTNEIITNIDSVEAPYDRYVEREDTLKDFLKVLDDNISCIQINGLGGIGKTSFIYNFCKKILNKEIKIKDFKPNYIIWITGKLTIFKPTGAIEKLKKFEINYDEFIDELVETLGIQLETDNKKEINELIYKSLETYPSLVIVDNMETINDKDITDFLMHIPKNSKVILTTRENMEDFSYRRINISGFSREQFHEYYLSQFKIFDVKKEHTEDQISNYEFVGEMNDEGNGQWKMMIERAEQNQYALSINHKEYLEYFSAKIQDIGDIKTNIPEIFLSSSKFISEDGKQEVKTNFRTISQTGDPVSSKFEIKAVDDIKDNFGKIKYQAGSRVSNITGNKLTENYLYPGKYQISQRNCADGYVRSQKFYNFEVKKQADCQIQSISMIIQNSITQLQLYHVTEDGKSLNDGIFTLYDEDQNPISSFRDVPYDHVQINGLTVGKKYHVMQNKEITGYQNIDCDFIVQDTSNIQHVYLYSKKRKKPDIKQVKTMSTLVFLLCLH